MDETKTEERRMSPQHMLELENVHLKVQVAELHIEVLERDLEKARARYMEVQKEALQKRSDLQTEYGKDLNRYRIKKDGTFEPVPTGF